MKVEVLTRSYNNARTGAKSAETTLTPAAVGSSGLRKLFSLAIHDDTRGIEAQPLIVPDITMPDGNKHDVVYLCSMANTIWAYDANNGAPLWPHPVSLGIPIKNTKQIDVWLINDHWGILSTPVIDRDTETMYVVSYSSADGTQNNAYKIAIGTSSPFTINFLGYYADNQTVLLLSSDSTRTTAGLAVQQTE